MRFKILNVLHLSIVIFCITKHSIVFAQAPDYTANHMQNLAVKNKLLKNTLVNCTTVRLNWKWVGKIEKSKDWMIYIKCKI